MNQAIGRVIRHKEDFGTIIFIDTRFEKKNIKQNISEWIRGKNYEHLNSWNNLESCHNDINQFFLNKKKIIS